MNKVCVWKAGQKCVCVCVFFCVCCVLVSCWHVFVWADLIPSRMASAHYSSGIVLQTSPEGSACWEIKQRKWACTRIYPHLRAHAHTSTALAKHWHADKHTSRKRYVKLLPFCHCQTKSLLRALRAEFKKSSIYNLVQHHIQQQH